VSCAICDGYGEYPIHDRYGSEWGWIKCPACFGSGLSDEEAELEARKRHDRQRYEAAMAARGETTNG
jgi:hypothetical protein